MRKGEIVYFGETSSGQMQLGCLIKGGGGGGGKR